MVLKQNSSQQELPPTNQFGPQQQFGFGGNMPGQIPTNGFLTRPNMHSRSLSKKLLFEENEEMEKASQMKFAKETNLIEERHQKEIQNYVQMLEKERHRVDKFFEENNNLKYNLKLSELNQQNQLQQLNQQISMHGLHGANSLSNMGSPVREQRHSRRGVGVRNTERELYEDNKVSTSRDSQQPEIDIKNMIQLQTKLKALKHDYKLLNHKYNTEKVFLFTSFLVLFYFAYAFYFNF